MTFKGSGCFQVPGDFPISFSNEDLIIISNMRITNPAFTFLNWFRARIFHRNGHFARNTWFHPKLASLNHMSSLVRQNLRRTSPLSSNIWGRPHSPEFQRSLQETVRSSWQTKDLRTRAVDSQIYMSAYLGLVYFALGTLEGILWRILLVPKIFETR